MDAWHAVFFFIIGALLGATFAAVVCWYFLLDDRGHNAYVQGWMDAYDANGRKISASMETWQWPTE